MRSTAVAQSDTGDDDLSSEDPSRDDVELLRRPTAAGETERPDPGQIRVLLVIEMSLVRGAFAALLSVEDDIDVVGGLELSEHVLPAALRLRPDVAVLDIDEVGADGLVTASQFHEQLPTCRVVALAPANRPGLVRRALSAHVAGAVNKDAQPDQLPATIRLVAEGQRAIDPTLAVAAPTSPLTYRELAVLGRAADGASPSEIAAQLFLSPGTVRNYLSRATRKTGARSRIDAIRIARDAGWL